MKRRASSELLVSLTLCLLWFSPVSSAQNINTVAGGGHAGGTSKSAFIAYPGGTVRDKAGNTYISSNWGHYVFKLDTKGNVSVVAGKGWAGFGGDGGPATRALLNVPGGLALDSAGNLYIGDSGNNRIRRVDAKTGIITTVAGNNTPNMFNTGGYGGDGGPATQALLNSPYTVAVDSQGNLFITDYLNFRIRRVDAKTQIITTIAGNGTGGYNGDNIPATSAEIYYAITVIVDKSNNLYIADSGNNRIRRVDGNTQVITTVAGNGTAGFKGDGGPAAQAELSFPNAVAEDAAKNLYVVDTGNNRVRLVNAKTQKIKTIVGTGVAGFGGDGGPATKAKITDSSGGYIDPSGNLLIADSGNQRVRIVNEQRIINTLAGGGSAGDKGKATNALLSFPTAIAFDAASNMYIAESGTPVVKKVSTGGTITTVAGTGSEGYSGDGGLATKAEFLGPNGIAIDQAGNLFIADTYNLRVRRVDHATHKVSTYAGNGSSCSTPPCGDGGLATNASLSSAFALAVDSAGNLYIADPYDQVIREVNAGTGIIDAVAGNYVKCTSGKIRLRRWRTSNQRQICAFLLGLRWIRREICLSPTPSTIVSGVWTQRRKSSMPSPSRGLSTSAETAGLLHKRLWLGHWQWRWIRPGMSLSEAALICHSAWALESRWCARSIPQTTSTFTLARRTTHSPFALVVTVDPQPAPC